MKILRKDKVMVITGRDKGKTGEVLAVLPKSNQVVVEGINVAKRHTKPSQAQPSQAQPRSPAKPSQAQPCPAKPSQAQPSPPPPQLGPSHPPKNQFSSGLSGQRK